MTELLFWETTIRKTPISFAIDSAPMLAIGIRLDSVPHNGFYSPNGWRDLTIYIGPLILTFTVYGRGS
jgi:hypothetical protein